MKKPFLVVWGLLIGLFSCNQENVAKTDSDSSQSVLKDINNYLEALNAAKLHAKGNEVVLLEKKCDGKSECRSCTVSTFTCDSNILIKQKEGSYMPLRRYAKKECFGVDLYIYKRVISLDSVYYSNIENEDLQYMGSFVEGTYNKNGNEIILSLTFVNLAINSSTPTDHTFLIDYNLTSHTVKHIDLKFDETDCPPDYRKE